MTIFDEAAPDTDVHAIGTGTNAPANLRTVLSIISAREVATAIVPPSIELFDLATKMRAGREALLRPVPTESTEPIKPTETAEEETTL